MSLTTETSRTAAVTGGPAVAIGDAGQDAVDALLALGYRESQVKGVVAELVRDDPGATAETLIRKALARVRPGTSRWMSESSDSLPRDWLSPATRPRATSATSP